MEFKLLPITEVYAGALFFPYERAGEVLEAWRRWTATVPDEVTSVGRMIQVPPLPEVPDFLRGKSFAVIEAAFLGSEEQADGAVRAAARARSGDGHVRDDRAAGPAGPPHGPPGAGSRASATIRCSPTSTPSPWRRSSRPSDPAPDRRCSRSSSAISAERSAGARRTAARSARSSGEFMTFAVGMLPVPEMEAPLRGFVRGGPRGAGGRRQRRQLRELRRAPGRPGVDLRRAVAGPAARDPRERRSRRSVPREPLRSTPEGASAGPAGPSPRRPCSSSCGPCRVHRGHGGRVEGLVEREAELSGRRRSGRDRARRRTDDRRRGDGRHRQERAARRDRRSRRPRPASPSTRPAAASSRSISPSAWSASSSRAPWRRAGADAALAGSAAPAGILFESGADDGGPGRQRLLLGPPRPLLDDAEPRRGRADAAGRRRPAVVRSLLAALPRLPRPPSRRHVDRAGDGPALERAGRRPRADGGDLLRAVERRDPAAATHADGDRRAGRAAIRAAGRRGVQPRLRAGLGRQSAASPADARRARARGPLADRRGGGRDRRPRARGRCPAPSRRGSRACRRRRGEVARAVAILGDGSDVGTVAGADRPRTSRGRAAGPGSSPGPASSAPTRRWPSRTHSSATRSSRAFRPVSASSPTRPPPG